MFRLIVALGVAAMLIPEDVHFGVPDETPSIANTAQVSTVDTISAAHSLFTDLSQFCMRNEEACLTGQALVINIAHTANSALNAIRHAPAEQTEIADTDQIVTSAVVRP